MKRKIVYAFFILTLFLAKLDAQPSEITSARPAFGGFGDFNLNMAHANFSQLPGVPDCNALYQSGTGIGPAFGLFYEMLLKNNFSILLRGVYDLYGEKLTSDEQTPIAINGIETLSTIEHSIQATLGMIGFQPMANYHITPALSVHLGGEIGVVIQSSFSQIETITQPATSGVFAENGLRTRNPQAGKLLNANPIVLSLLGGVSYELPLNQTHSLQAVPEISYAFGLTPIVKNLSWSVSALRAGVAIRYEIPESPVEQPKPPPVDTLPPPPLPIAPPVASITATGVDANGVESPVATMRVEEVYSVQMTPLVPYIFFEEHSQILPPRYSRLDGSAATGFEEISLKHSDGMTINHQTLNVIGRRLVHNPEATITLVGITLNRSKSAIDKKLALARSETVADYLKKTWNISADRISVTTHSLPEEIVVALDSDGIAEANRVEVTSNTFDILQPVMGNDTIRNVMPTTIRFHPSVKYSQALTSWDVIASQDGKMLKDYNGRALPPSSLDWIAGDDQKSVPNFPGKIDYTLTVTGSNNEQVQAAGAIEVEQVSLRKKKLENIADREVEKFNLLLFDLESSELNETNKQIITLIQKNVKSLSKVTIVGHTDRTGDPEKNKILSLERAKNTAKALGITNAVIKGIANETILYDNTLPEGRCLSRTVDIIVETPSDTQ
jgi:outer membrane protein OmpA-like peptidoglycan-associated protein